MTTSSSVAMLLARLRLLCPDARVIVLAAARPRQGTRTIAWKLALAARDAGQRVRWVDASSPEANSGPRRGRAADSSAPPEGVESVVVPAAKASLPGTLRAQLSVPDACTIVAGDSVLDSPSTLFLCAAADATVLIAFRQRTTRAELTAARDAISEAGGNLTASVLVG